MVFLDGRCPFEVCERKADSQNSMISSSGKREPFDTFFQQGARFALDARYFLQASSREARVGAAFSVALLLQASCAKNSVPDHSAILGCNRVS